MVGEDVHNRISRPATCHVSSHRSLEGARSHFGSSDNSSLDLRPSLIAAALKRALAFPRARRDRGSDLRKKPRAPCGLVTAIPERTHRQCAGVAAPRVSFSTICKPSTHSTAFCSVMRSSSCREVPVLPTYATTMTVEASRCCSFAEAIARRTSI
eukprot:5404381-Prymnesium_polylepis.1